MRKFIFRTTFFIALSTIMMAALDCVVTYQAQHSNIRPYWKWNQAIRNGYQSDLLIIGNSRAWCHYSPAILDSVLGSNSLNLGLDGAGFDWEMKNYNIYRQHNPKPKAIILNFDYTCFVPTNGYERHQFFPYFLSRELRDSVFPLDPFGWAERNLPMYRYAHYGLDNFFCKKPYTLYKGYAGQNRHWSDAAFEHVEHPTFAQQQQITEMVGRQLARAKSEGIEVVLVHAPTYHKYYQGIDKLDSMWDIIYGWSEKYNIPVLDYTSDSICFDTAYFYNPRHLNKQGAERISRQLAEDISILLPGLFAGNAHACDSSIHHQQH